MQGAVDYAKKAQAPGNDAPGEIYQPKDAPGCPCCTCGIRAIEGAVYGDYGMMAPGIEVAIQMAQSSA